VGRKDWGKAVDDAIEGARAQEYKFWRRRRGAALARFRSTRDVELLVDGSWVRIVKPLTFHKWERLGDDELRQHAHGFLVSGFADAVAAGLGRRERWGRSGPMRLINPPLPGGAETQLGDLTIESAGRYCGTQVPTGSAESLAQVKEHALLGHATLADRCAVLEQRANFFLGAAGLTTSLVLANSGLLLGTSRLDDPWLTAAVVFLAFSTVCALIAGLRAMQAAMTTFIRTTPNGVMQIVGRTGVPSRKLTRLYVGSLLVAQKREEVIGSWKLARLKAARRWFLALIVGISLLTGVVVLDVLGTGPAPDQPSAVKTQGGGAGPLVPEVPVLREDHRHAGGLAGLDHLGVAFGAARLDHGGGARLDRRLGPVGEGEEGV
jgi:hypothetical protein